MALRGTVFRAQCWGVRRVATVSYGCPSISINDRIGGRVNAEGVSPIWDMARSREPQRSERNWRLLVLACRSVFSQKQPLELPVPTASIHRESPSGASVFSRNHAESHPRFLRGW